MKNKLILTFFINFFLFMASTVLGQDQFNFDVTEVEITENGNKFKGIKRGTIKTNDGIIINADEFDYHKVKNILNAKGKVRVFDQLNNYIIYSDKITYFKNNEIIFSSGNSKAISENIIIEANRFEYDKNLNIITANDNVRIDDIKEGVIIFSQNIKYKIIIVLAAHDEFKNIDSKNWMKILEENHIIYDLKGIIPRDVKPLRI